MSSSKKRKKNEKTVKIENQAISEERLTEIYAEAYYRALKRIEQEKSTEPEQNVGIKEKRWGIRILFALNLFLFPFKINKRFKYNKRMHEGFLKVIISSILEYFGFVLWFLGLAGLGYGIWNIHAWDVSVACIIYFIICIESIMMGSFFFLAGKTFDKETESNRIYAYSACVLALVSCITSLVALLRV